MNYVQKLNQTQNKEFESFLFLLLPSFHLTLVKSLRRYSNAFKHYGDVCKYFIIFHFREGRTKESGKLKEKEQNVLTHVSTFYFLHVMEKAL